MKFRNRNQEINGRKIISETQTNLQIAKGKKETQRKQKEVRDIRDKN